MQFGHVILGLSIATYYWSAANAAFCVGMHYLPNADSLVAKARLDKKIIKAAARLEAFVRRDPGLRHPAYRPETDPFWVEMGGFHCTVTHSILFAVVVSLPMALFSLQYAAFTFVALAAHYAADIGSSVGLPLLWPFTRKKYTLALFRDTGWWGMEMLAGYYRQPMAWVLEGTAVVFFVYRWMVI